MMGPMPKDPFAKVTPRPWTHKRWNDDEHIIEVTPVGWASEDPGIYIAKMGGWSYAGNENAAHIVKCVNSHDHLIREMSWAVNFWLKQRDKFKLANGDVANRDAAYLIEQMDVYITRMQTTLAKATGGEG